MDQANLLFWIINILVLIHVFFGCTAFACMLVPLLSKKGGRRHKNLGGAFALSVYIAGFSVVSVVLLQLFFELKKEGVEAIGAKFLMICALSAICSVTHGRQSIKYKERVSRQIRPHLALIFMTTIGFSIHVCLEGKKIESPAFFWFSILIIVVHCNQLRYWLTRPSYKMHWWPAHMDGMLNGCNAVISGFALRTATNNYSLNWTHSWLFWFLPSLIILPAAYIWLSACRLKFIDQQNSNEDLIT